MTTHGNFKDAAGQEVVEPTGPPRQPGEPRISQIRTKKDNNGCYEHLKVPAEGDLSAKARAVIDKVRVLQKYTCDTGFRTTRSQNDLLQTLDGDDLANALLVLKYGR